MAYISFIIENQEPLKIGANGNKSSQKEPTKEYIPGNTLRGAILNKIFRLTGEVTGKLLTQVHFYNAYLIEDDKIFFPTPLHLRIDKHSWRQAKATGKDEMDINNLVAPIYDGKNNLDSKFIAIQPNKLKGIKIQKTYRLHHSLKKNKDKEERDNLFRYEAVDVGHHFKGIISVPDEETRTLILNILKKEELVLGGSKSSGYGKCSIKVMKEKEETLNIGEHSFGDDKLILTCLSDGVFRNQYGLPINKLEDSYLEKYFGELELLQQFIDTSITEGYNVKWGTRLPKETSVKSGSVWVYKMKNKPENLAERIQEFESRLHGERQMEGYGWIGVNIDYPQTFVLQNGAKEETSKVRTATLEKSLIEKINEVKKNSNLEMIFEGIQESKMDWIREMAYREIKASEKNKENKTVISQLNTSQINELLQIITKEGIDKKDIDKKERNYINNRHFTTDNDEFSFIKQNFKTIVEYVFDNKVNSCLHTYGNNKLAVESDKAILPRIYFKYREGEADSLKEEKYREFIKLLVREILYLLQRKIDSPENKDGDKSE